MTTRITGHCLDALVVPTIAHVVDQCPRTVHGGRAKIRRIPADNIARRIANAATYALDACVDLLTLCRFGRDPRELVLASGRRLELPLRRGPFVEELAHVRHEILDEEVLKLEAKEEKKK